MTDFGLPFLFFLFFSPFYLGNAGCEPVHDCKRDCMREIIPEINLDREAFDCRARFLACGFVAATNLFSLDECRGRSVAKNGPSPLASIRQVFYIGLMRNCRGSPVNSCQCGISFVRRSGRSYNDSRDETTYSP